MVRSIGVCAALCLALFARTQGRLTHSRQVWLHLNMLIVKEEGAGFRFDMSVRHLEGHPGLSQYLLRGGLAYGLPLGISAVTGLARIRTYQDGGGGRSEWRPYQDLSWSTGTGKTLLQQRLRTEARFFRDAANPGAGGGGHVELRLRYRLQGHWPVATLSDRHPERQLLLTAGDEVMVNPVHGPDSRFFGTNRILLSPTIRWHESLEIAFVLNHQYSARGAARDAESAEVLWIQYTRRFPRMARKSGRRG